MSESAVYTVNTWNSHYQQEALQCRPATYQKISPDFRALEFISFPVNAHWHFPNYFFNVEPWDKEDEGNSSSVILLPFFSHRSHVPWINWTILSVFRWTQKWELTNNARKKSVRKSEVCLKKTNGKKIKLESFYRRPPRRFLLGDTRGVSDGVTRVTFGAAFVACGHPGKIFPYYYRKYVRAGSFSMTNTVRNDDRTK